MTRREREARPPAPRDMDPSAFTDILNDLLARVPGAYAAALVDRDGETVDYSGHIDPFDARIAGAEVRMALSQLTTLQSLGTVRTLAIRGTKKSVVARLLVDGYALVVLLVRWSGLTSSARAFSNCQGAFLREAGLTAELSPHAEHGMSSWFAVQVECDEQRRPQRILYGGLSERVEVIGRLQGLTRRERGYRIRLASGPEVTLVREAGSFWYVEEHGSA